MSHGGVLPKRFAESPGSSTDNSVARFDGTNGRDIQDSGIIVSDSNDVTGMNSLVIDASLTVGTDITVGGTVDGRDIAADGVKLDGVEDNADVTDATNVASAGAVMQSLFTKKGSIVIGASPGAVTELVPGTNGQVLTLDITQPKGMKWAAVASGSGDVVGPASATDNAVARFDGTTGKLIQNSSFVVNDSGAVTSGSWTATDIAVADGGTGRSTATAYAVLCGGTTATAAHQSVAALGSSGQVLTSNGAGALPTFQDATGGSTAKEYWFSAESLQPTETNFAALTLVEGTTVKTFARSFDDTTEEYVNGKLQVPSDVDTGGTVTFRAYVSAVTATASKNIGLTFGHRAITNSEAWDGSYTEEDSGATAIDATQGDVTLVSWTETISNLAWAANDLVFFRISRDTAVADDLTGDMYLFSLSISIPRSA